MELTQHVADGQRRLLVLVGCGEPELAHGVDDAPLDGLQAVTYRGEGAVQDDVHRVVEVRLLGEGAQGLALYAFEVQFLVLHGMILLGSRLLGAVTCCYVPSRGLPFGAPVEKAFSGTAVNPSVEAAGKTSCFSGSRKKLFRPMLLFAFPCCTYTCTSARLPFCSSQSRRSLARFLARSMSISWSVLSLPSIVSWTRRRVRGSIVVSRSWAGFISPRPLNRVTVGLVREFSFSMRFRSWSRSPSSRA